MAAGGCTQDSVELTTDSLSIWWRSRGAGAVWSSEDIPGTIYRCAERPPPPPQSRGQDLWSDRCQTRWMWCIIFWCLFLTLSSIFSWIFSSYESVLFANTHSIALSSCQDSPFGPSFWPADCDGAGLFPSLERSTSVVCAAAALVVVVVVVSLVLPRFLVIFVAPFVVLVLVVPFIVLLSSSLRRSALRLHFFCIRFLCRAVHCRHFLFIFFVIVVCIIRSVCLSPLPPCLSPPSSNCT